jgi:hypothetical protein
MVSRYPQGKVAMDKRDQLVCSGLEWGLENRPVHHLRLRTSQKYEAVVLSLGLGVSVHQIRQRLNP